MSSDPLAQDSIVALAADLVRIPSVSPTIAPAEAHGEQAVASFAVQWLAARGIKAWLEEAAPGRPNAVAEVVGSIALAADVGLGQPLDHVLRSCVVATRFAEHLGLSPEDRTALQPLLNSAGSDAALPASLEYLREFARHGTLEVAGYGDRRPRDPNDPSSAKNRRVEVVLEFRESPPDGKQAVASILCHREFRHLQERQGEMAAELFGNFGRTGRRRHFQSLLSGKRSQQRRAHLRKCADRHRRSGGDQHSAGICDPEIDAKYRRSRASNSVAFSSGALLEFPAT